MHVTVVVFPGSNADSEMIHTLRDVVGVKTTTAWHRDAELPAGTDLVALPGGFSYGDYLRSGAIAKTSPILRAIRLFAEKGGPVLGVCNGFQILTEAGLLPGALTRNAHRRFESKDIYLTPVSTGMFTSGLPKVLRMPIAHADGRYQASETTLRALTNEDAVAFRYCDAEGNVSEAANPNGSQQSIAGIYGGPKRNILGLMPHPERASDQAIGRADGRLLFEAWARAHAGREAPVALGASL